ncbi:MAG: hemerythrin domain-containing protein [Bdellovibrionota bacterium]
MSAPSFALQDALNSLEQEHRDFTEALDRIRDSASSTEKRTILESIRNEFILHMHREERVFYSEFLSLPELQDKIPRSLDEHSEIQRLIGQIESTTDSEEVLSLFEILDRIARWHFQTEEAIYYPIARRTMRTVA